MHYWATDLNTSLENSTSLFIGKEKAYWDPRNNPATWQSMTNFIVGLALTSSWISQIFLGVAVHAGIGYRNLSGSDTTWITAASGDITLITFMTSGMQQSTREESFTALTALKVVQAFDDILTRIADRKSSAAMQY